MKYWYDPENKTWGKCRDKEDLPESAQCFKSEEERLNAFPMLATTIEDHKQAMSLSMHDFADVGQMHTIKAFEAALFLHMGAPEEACPYCKAYADSEGIEFIEAVKTVWKNHIAGAAIEAERTKQKSAIRRQSLSSIEQCSD